MAFPKVNDRVKETSTTTGTGTLNLDGAETGFESFVAGIGSTNDCWYAIFHRSANEWEVGRGVVTDASPDTLSRAAVLSSSNADALVSLSAGTKEIFVVNPANNIDKGQAKGWAHFTISGGTPTLQDNYNVSSITDNAAGNYTVNWNLDIINATYAVSSQSDQFHTDHETFAAGSVIVKTFDASHALADAGVVTAICFGDS